MTVPSGSVCRGQVDNVSTAAIDSIENGIGDRSKQLGGRTENRLVLE